MECAVCKSKYFEKWAVAKDYEYQSDDINYLYCKCISCGVIQISNFPIDKLMTIYPSNYYSFIQSKGNLISRVKDFLDIRLFKKLLNNISGDALRVLDIGGGTGAQLDLVVKADSRVNYTQIVDLDNTAMKVAELKGHKYYCGTFDTFRSDEKFDIVLMLNIIEHVSNPLQMLEAAKNLLSDEGILVIKTPNTESFDAKVFKNTYWGGLHAPRHWVLFNSVNIRCAVENVGLCIKNIKYTQGASFWAWSIVKILSDFGLVKVSPKFPMYSKNITIILTGLFAAIDFILLPLKKSSQIIVIANCEKR